ncbi:hypothetical protein [Sporosarcina sp. G11-34]|uniref:hypothetical protein n=1 Tax=Sporosarcina sp. G11-34 TaxID=2849605 RepID=UPI0022A905E4|nr:hypothetical protein [Sporosarcina sp. G11-34]MCZ2259064.1 hypothetical protein [Sporosarcina sp. G11-34]
MKETGLKRGQPITFRIPSDTSDQTLKRLQKLKEVERRNFSSKIAEFVIEGVNASLLKHKEAIVVPLPKGLSKAQRDWLKHEHSEALLGSIVYQLMSNPVRTAALLTSLNSNVVDIEDPLYRREEVGDSEDHEPIWQADREDERTEVEVEVDLKDIDLDAGLDDFDWETVRKETSSSTEEDVDEVDPLADFLAQMNK